MKLKTVLLINYKEIVNKYQKTDYRHIRIPVNVVCYSCSVDDIYKIFTI